MESCKCHVKRSRTTHDISAHQPLSAGDGPVIKIMQEWVRTLKLYRDTNKATRANNCEEYLRRVLEWRANTAQQLNMAPGAVLTDHLAKKAISHACTRACANTCTYACSHTQTLTHHRTPAIPRTFQIVLTKTTTTQVKPSSCNAGTKSRPNTTHDFPPQALQQLGVRINSVAKLAATMEAAIEELEPAASASASSTETSTCTPITLPIGLWKPNRWQLAAPSKKKKAAWEVGF